MTIDKQAVEAALNILNVWRENTYLRGSVSAALELVIEAATAAMLPETVPTKLQEFEGSPQAWERSQKIVAELVRNAEINRPDTPINDAQPCPVSSLTQPAMGVDIMALKIDLFSEWDPINKGTVANVEEVLVFAVDQILQRGLLRADVPEGWIMAQKDGVTTVPLKPCFVMVQIRGCAPYLEMMTPEYNPLNSSDKNLVAYFIPPEFIPATPKESG